MAKTKDELLKMSFMQLKNHCKSLNIKITFGATKASMIKLILTADPPPISQQTEDKRSKEAQLQQKLVDTAIYEKKEAIEMNDNNNDNSLSLSQARKIVKRYCPRRGQMGMTIYPGFISAFRATAFANLSVNQFMAALVTGNDTLLGMDNISSLSTYLFYWDDISNNNGWDLCKQHLNSFIPPTQCAHEDKLMFSIFNIPNLIPRIRLIEKLYSLRENVLKCLYFMDTFNESMRAIISNEIYSKIFLSSLILSKFRNEDIALSGHERYANIIDFLQKISTKPTAKELFQSKRWNTLKEKGKLVDEINKPQFIMTDADFNKIREKAIKFGSALQPQMPRMLKHKMDQKTKQQQIKNDIGAIDTKALQNKLQNALKNKLKRNQNDDNDDEYKQEVKQNDSCVDNIDLTEYKKMLQIGVKIDAVIHEMTVNGIPQSVIDQFVAESDCSLKPERRRLPNALMASISNVAPVPPPVPIPAPIPAAIAAAAPIPAPPILAAHGHGISNGMFTSSMVPDKHSNIGLNWKQATAKYKVVMSKVQRLRVLIYGLDIQLYRQENNIEEEEGEEKKEDFYDASFNIYIAQINRIEKELKNWMIKSDENADILKKLEIGYHCRYRPEIFKQLTKSRYNALQEAANQYDEDIFVPQDIIGVIWMFVKPFDELIELKFAVDCVNEFFNKDKKEISVKKLPIQSHRGYEVTFIL